MHHSTYALCIVGKSSPRLQKLKSGSLSCGYESGNTPQPHPLETYMQLRTHQSNPIAKTQLNKLHEHGKEHYAK
jgi:hypothetical protein